METGNSTWGDHKFDYEIFIGIETIIFFCYKQHNLSILLSMAMWVVSILWCYKHHCSKLTCVSWCTGVRVILRLWFSLKSPAESSRATDALFPSQTNYMTDSKYGQKWGKWGKWGMGGAWKGAMSSIFFSIFNLLIIQISPIVPKCILFLFYFIFHLRTQFQSISCI